jgi:uncharacterized protein DUF4397
MTRAALNPSTEYHGLMRRIFQLSMLFLAVGVVNACNPDQVVHTDAIPTGGVRFINAVPDTNPMDFRFVDVVENSAHFRIAFRNNPVTTGTGATAITASTQIQYKPAQEGQRHFRIFLNDTAQSVASTVMKDSTITVVAGKNYTVLLWGYANPTGPNRPAGAPAMKLTVIEESVPDPGAQVALRVINATGDAVDVREYSSSGTPPAAPTWAAVPPISASAYVTTPPDTLRFNVLPAGGGTALFADARALVGAAALLAPPGPTDAAPGTTVAGSALTAIIFPRSVAGTKAPQVTGFGVPAISFMWDRRPARPPGT